MGTTKSEDAVSALLGAQLLRIEAKVDQLDNRIDCVDRTMIKNTASLEEHMRRSDLLEGQMDLLRESITPLIKVHVTIVGIGKILAAIALVVGVISACLELLAKAKAH